MSWHTDTVKSCFVASGTVANCPLRLWRITTQFTLARKTMLAPVMLGQFCAPFSSGKDLSIFFPAGLEDACVT